MKVKYRHVYTVTKTSGDKKSISELKEELKFLKDEPGEYLYGSRYGKEKIEVRCEVERDGKWINVETPLHNEEEKTMKEGDVVAFRRL